MFRRSRFSVRPNVGTVGRTAAATPQEAPSASQEASETPTDISESRTTAAVTENKSVVTASEKPTSSGDGNDQNGEGASASAAVQRRKRFSIKPKVAPGRLSTLSRTPKSPAKAVSETSISDLAKPTTSSQSGTPASPRGLQSPRRRRPSEDSRQLKVQPKPFIQSDTSGPSAVPPADDSQEQTVQSANTGKLKLESPSDGPVKEVSFAVPVKVKPSLTDKEATEISEKAKTLVSSRCNLSLSTPAFSLSRLLNDPSDMQKIAKAQKLRELLRQEMHREKGKKKLKAIKKEFSLDPAKMTMRDLIRYLPEANPMTSSLEETVIENETVVVPPSPAREASPERAQDPEPVPEVTGPGEEEEEEDQEEDQDDSLMVPQVKVAEDGTLIIDEESLTVEVLRAKGPNPANDRDPIFERGSTTTYASFRKATYSKPWSSEETDMFFLAISMVGTDFSMICQLFPHRARSMIKNKFKKEEKENSWRVDKAFRERRKLDIEYFSKLLEKILEVQKTRKKLKSVAEKNPPKKEKKKRKSRKTSKKLIDVQEEDEDNESSLPDLEGEGEKENEDLCNEGETEVSKIQKKRKRKSDALIEEPKEKKNKAGKKDSEQDEACVPEDAEAAPPMDNTNPDMSEKSEDVNAAKGATIKPAKLSRGRAPKPLLPLGRKWGKKPPKASTKGGDAASDKEDESEMDGASKEQLSKDASPQKQANKKSDNDDNSSEEEETTVQPLKPTRYGRVPKPIKPLNYPAREDAHSSASESTSASSARPEPKPPAKRGRSSKAQSAQESKKSKLVTLRASQTDYSDEDNGEQWEEQQEEEQQQQPACGSIHDSIAPAFVPASLRSPHPMISEVEETMEELEILANMPDVLGISQDALCPDASCELAQNETGTSEPCEHQLDLLVDVIDFLSSEHPEVTEDESYNEAAQTLLTISSLAHISQPEQNQLVTQEPTTETMSANLSESTTHLEEEIALMHYAQEEKNASPFISAASIHGVIETSETVTTLELQGSTTDSEGMQSCNQQTGVDVDPMTKLHASPEGSKKDCTPTKRGRLSKVKPKPNLGRALRAAPSKSQPDTSTAEESGTDAPNLVKATGTISAAEEIPEVIARHEDMSKDDNVHLSCSDVKLTEEQSGTQERSDAMTSGPETQRLNDTGDSWSNESHVWSAPRSTSNLATSDAAVEDLQIGPATNLDSALVQESSEPLASGVTPVEDFLDSQKQDSRHASSPKTGISRFQKVKPKPNLAKSSRALRSKPQTTNETIENDPNPTPNLEIISAEPTSLEKPGQSAGSATDSTTLLEFGPALTLSAGIANMDEKKTVVGIQDSSENQIFSVALSNQSTEQAAIETKPTPESTDDEPISNVEPSYTGGSNQPKSDTVVTESQVEQGSIIDSAPVVPAEVLPVCQKQENEGSSTCKTRISRFQKVKPKPNVAQASRALRSKPQTAKETIENDPNPTPNLEILSAEPTSLEKPGQRAGSASDSATLLEFGPDLTLSEEIPNMDEKKTVVGIVSGDDNLGAATLDQDSSENQIFSVALSNQSTEQAAIETKPTPESTDDEPSYTGGSNQPKSDTVVTESQVEQGSIIDSAPVVPAEVLPVSQKQEKEGSSTCKTRISRFQKVKPKPNVAQASRALRSKPQTANETIENDPNPTPNLEILSAEPTSLEKPGQRAGSASDSATFVESQVEQGSIIDSAPVVPAEVLPVSQKQENEGSSTCKTRISRFQKVAQASRTVRSKPQTAKETVEEKSQPTQNLNVHEKTTDVCAEPTCITLTEDPREDIGLALDLIPSSVLESTLPTEEMAKTEREEEEVGVAGCSVTFDQRPSENQIFYEAQFDTTSASQPTVQDLTSHVGTTESRSSYSQTSHTTVTESPVEQGSNVDSASLQKQSDLPISHVEPELPVSQKQESEEASSAQARRSRFQRVKLKPNVALTSRTARPKPQTTSHVEEKDSIEIPKPTLQEQTKVEFFGPPACTTSPEKTSQSTGPAPDDMPSLDLASAPSPKGHFSVNEEQKKDTQDFGGGTVPSEKPGQIDSIGSVSKSKLELVSTQKASEDLSSAEEPVTDVGRDSSSEGSQLNVAQRRRRVSRVKPNIGSSTRARQTKIQSDDRSKPLGQCHKDSPENTSQQREVESTDKDSEELKTTQCSLPAELLSSTKSGPEEPVDILKDKAVSLTADGQSDSVLETTKKSNVEWDKMPTSEKVDAGAAPHWDHKEDTFIGAIEIPTAVSDVQSTEGKDSHSQSNLPANKPSTSDSGGNPPLPESQHQDVQQRSGTNQTAAQSTPEDHLNQTDSPKPDLGLPQPQRVQDADQAAADSAPNSDGVDVSVSHKALPELQPDIQEQVEEALSQLSSQNLPPSVAGSSFGCEVEAPYRSTQDAPLQSTEESLSDPSLSIFPDMLSEQMPSDSEEKFIILSLIEIPVCQQEDPSLLLPCPAVTEASMQQQSVPAECVTAAGVESVSSAALDVSAEESQQTGLIKAPGSDSAARTGSITDKQVEQQGSAAVQPATLPGSVEGAEETERPPTKQKLQGATRRAKRQVNTSRKKQADPTVPAEEEESPPLQTNATEESELPGLSVQPRESDTPQKKGASKKAPTASRDPEESRSAAHTRPTRATRNRNLRGSLPETNNMAAPSCSTPARATSRARKVKTPRAARKQSAAEPEASTSREVAPTLSSPETCDEPQPTPVTSALTADGTFDLGDAALGSSQSLLEVFPSQQSLDLDGSSIEDATSVSQYFLSDIFTDVDEG